MKEVLLANQMTKRSTTPSEIREAVIRGDWRDVDVYSTAR